MAKYLFNEEEFHKRVKKYEEDMEKYSKKSYTFLDDDRSIFDKVKIGDDMVMDAMDKQGDIVALSFRLTTIMPGPAGKWFYGHLKTSDDDDYYRQIEFKLRNDNPKSDTIEVFTCPPPII